MAVIITVSLDILTASVETATNIKRLGNITVNELQSPLLLIMQTHFRKKDFIMESKKHFHISRKCECLCIIIVEVSLSMGVSG